MLAIEYDVTAEGHIEIVALVNAVDEGGDDPEGAAWIEWRRSHDDAGMGCAPVPAADLQLLEQAADPGEVRAVVERIVLTDRAGKEAAS